MCRERDSNPHSHYWPRDFKSLVSTNSTIAASLKRRKLSLQDLTSYRERAANHPLLSNKALQRYVYFPKSQTNSHILILFIYEYEHIGI